MKYTRTEWNTLMRVLTPADEMSAVERILDYCHCDANSYERYCDIHIHSHLWGSTEYCQFVACIHGHSEYGCEFSADFSDESVTVEAEEHVPIIAAFRFLCTIKDGAHIMYYEPRRVANLRRDKGKIRDWYR